jgi:DNA-binding NarL/FixJ family response regulator
MDVRLLLVDDERLVRSGFRAILSREPGIAVVGEAENGGAAVEACARLEPDVVLMDVRMPGMDGLEATRQIVAGANPPRVVVLTTFDNDEYVYEALRVGASGFLLKDAPEDRLVAAVRVAADGGSMFAPSVTRTLIEAFAGRRGAGAPSDAAELTEREREVLRLLARGLSNAEIAGELVVSEHTAKTHIAHILSKLGLRSRTQAVVFAYEHGLAR